MESYGKVYRINPADKDHLFGQLQSSGFMVVPTGDAHNIGKTYVQGRLHRSGGIFPDDCTLCVSGEELDAFMKTYTQSPARPVGAQAA